MADHEKTLHYARVISVIAGTIISLACGTNYAFSAYGPQLAAKLHFSSTETNLIATFGNLGLYMCGIPVGMMTDKKGAKPGVLGGSILVGFGYFMLHKAYDAGPGVFPLPLLCIFSFFTGLGGCAAFAGAVKTSALNWPQHRGTATAFPLAAFGLSAFFFASLSRIFAPNNTSEFFLILCVGGFSLIFVPSFFLRVIPYIHGYKKVASDGGDRNKLHRIDSNGSRKASIDIGSEPGPSTSSSNLIRPSEEGDSSHLGEEGSDGSGSDNGEDHRDDDLDGIEGENPLLTDLETAENAITIPAESAHKSVYADVRGAQMLKYVEFYQYFLILGLLTGTGLMTINNIGNDAQALWSKFDPTVTLDMIRQRQSIHVSLLSLFSFLGRLASGIGSDLVVKKFNLSRVWCLFGSAVVFALAQTLGLSISNPNYLLFLSGLTGLAYGFLFGCFPSAVAETFGVGGLSTNWGVLTLAPVLFANIFNLTYGAIFDSHSTLSPDHKRECHDGKFCYQGAYWFTLVASLAALCISLWSIWHQGMVKKRIGWKGEGGHLS